MAGIDIPVTYKSNELTFKGTYMKFGYTHKFEVEVEGNNILFEPDEEGNYRAVANAVKMDNIKNVDADLLKQIASTLNTLNE